MRKESSGLVVKGNIVSLHVIAVRWAYVLMVERSFLTTAHWWCAED